MGRPTSLLAHQAEFIPISSSARLQLNRSTSSLVREYRPALISVGLGLAATCHHSRARGIWNYSQPTSLLAHAIARTVRVSRTVISPLSAFPVEITAASQLQSTSSSCRAYSAVASASTLDVTARTSSTASRLASALVAHASRSPPVSCRALPLFRQDLAGSVPASPPSSRWPAPFVQLSPSRWYGVSGDRPPFARRSLSVVLPSISAPRRSLFADVLCPSSFEASTRVLCDL
ncbi:unnamed protein product [Linum trigynum]|uniref:Uncharacterized protein n=1 Tax=Linum trigynum TaxID=586398 RepID=A0AAV2ERP2_9ROSI